MKETAGAELKQLKVDGGASANNLLMQFQADISQVDVVRPACRESTAQGAAGLAGLAVGFWKDLQELSAIRSGTTLFIPKLSEPNRTALLAGWKRAVACASGWAR